MISIEAREIALYKDEKIKEFKIKNTNGMELIILNYGCIITKWTAKNLHGEYENIVLGFDEFEPYLTESPYFGAVIGPVAGRIEKAAFQLEGKTYTLDANDGENTLHGGIKGLDKVVWESEFSENQELIFRSTRPHLNGGFPGTVQLKVTYRLLENDTLEVEYHGKTDQATILNMTNHTYFNLSGDFAKSIADHELRLKSSHYLPLKETLIPTGEIASVDGTVFDFRQGEKLVKGFESRDKQIGIGGDGFDHPFVLDVNFNEEISLRETSSGRMLTLETDQKSVVFYSGNQMESNKQIRGYETKKHTALCLETQNFPNAINESSFPSIIVTPDQPYSAKTKYTFTVE